MKKDIKKNNPMKLGFGIWLELHLKEEELERMDSDEFQKLITVAIKKWVSYDWLIEFLSNSRSLEVAISDLIEFEKRKE